MFELKSYHDRVSNEQQPIQAREDYNYNVSPNVPKSLYSILSTEHSALDSVDTK